MQVVRSGQFPQSFALLRYLRFALHPLIYDLSTPKNNYFYSHDVSCATRKGFSQYGG